MMIFEPALAAPVEVGPRAWVVLDYEDATAIDNSSARDQISSVTQTNGSWWEVTLDDDDAFAADYPSRMQGYQWPLKFAIAKDWDTDLEPPYGINGGVFVFGVKLDTDNLPTAAANVAVLIGLSDALGDAGESSTRTAVGGVRCTTSGRVCVASDRNVEVVSGAVEDTEDDFLIQVSLDARRLHRVTCVSGSSKVGASAEATDTETGVYDEDTLVLALYIGADSTADSGPHTVRFKPYAYYLPPLE